MYVYNIYIYNIYIYICILFKVDILYFGYAVAGHPWPPENMVPPRHGLRVGAMVVMVVVLVIGVLIVLVALMILLVLVKKIYYAKICFVKRWFYVP